MPRRRGELATAALTVVRAYLAAGSPRPPVATFGRFEAWQAWCRFPLIWLGAADPCETRGAAEARDPVRERLVQLALAWRELFGESDTTVAQAIKAAEPNDRGVADPVKPAVGTTRVIQRALQRGSLMGTRPSDVIMASGLRPRAQAVHMN